MTTKICGKGVIGFLCGLFLAGAVVVVSGQSQPLSQPNSAQGSVWGHNVDRTWENVLYENLMRFQKGQYKEAYEALETTISTRPPGPEVHRCMGLLRKSFMRWQGHKEPFGAWSDSAQKYIDAIASKETKSDADYAILATIAYVGQRKRDGVSVAGPLLTRLQSSSTKSPWADWAYWMMTRLQSDEAWAMQDDIGLVECDIAGIKRTGCLTDNPRKVVRARAAAVFLRTHPTSYMARQMRLELYLGRMTMANSALESLVNNEWFVEKGSSDGVFPMGSDQVASIQKAQAAIRSVGKSMPANAEALAQAEDKLDDFLWNAHSEDNIIVYLRGIEKVKGKEALPAPVLQWLQELPAAKASERHRWEPGQ